MAKWSSQHNGKYPDPYSKLKFNDEKKKEKKKKKNKNRDRERENKNKIISQIDSNANKVRYLSSLHAYTAIFLHLHYKLTVPIMLMCEY